jgi:hypothetical protein
MSQTRIFFSSLAQRSRLIVLVALAALMGCASVEHIQLYRQARQDFSDAARLDNVGAIRRIAPDATQIESMKSSVRKDLTRPAGPGNPNDADVEVAPSFERWQNVYAEFAALNGRASRELAADHLLGSSQALQILSQARRDLYAQLLKVDGSSGAEVTAPPLTEAVAQANALLNNSQIKLFPRDAYLLRVLEPLTRYEIAYVNASSLSRRKSPLSADEIDDLLAQIAQAEKDTESAADAAGDARGSILPHATMSRFMMLVAGEFLLQEKANVQLPMDAGVAKPGAAELGARVARFRGQALTNGAPEHELFLRLGLAPDDQRLTTWGVGLIITPPPAPPSL